MSLRTRRPDPPTIAALPEQDADRFIAVLRDELNSANQERKGLTRERDHLADTAKRLTVERDDLSTRSLPFVQPSTWRPTDQPVGDLLFDETAERLDFMPGLRTDGDDVDWAEQIRRFGDAVAAENPDPRRDQ